MVSNEEIRAMYEVETGESYCRGNGAFTKEYSSWLEDELVGAKVQLEFANLLMERI